MENLNHMVNRYSEADLAEFKTLLETKLQKAEVEKSFLLDQIQSITENEDGDVDWQDDTSTSGDLTMLYAQASRLNQNIRDINNALVRIHNKSYGICTVTGRLIDKRRLLAVPTTTKSLEGKSIMEAEEAERKPILINRAPQAVAGERKIISKIVSKPMPKANIPTIEDNEIDSFYDNEDEDIDFDLLSDEDTDDEIGNLNEIEPPEEETN